MKIVRLLTVAILATCASGAAPLHAEISDKEFAAKMKTFLASEEGRSSIGSTVEEYIRLQKQKMAAEEQERRNKEKEEQFKNPIKVDPGSSPAKGPEDAPITIIEFSDFECPYCSRGRNTLEAVYDDESLKGKVRVVFKNFPLEFHSNAKPAARAALAAHKQGKFWEFHDKLFENQRKLSPKMYESIAKDLGLDIAQFKKDMESKEVKQQLEEDLKDAKTAGVRGTPLFLINGVKLSGAQPKAAFMDVINKHLEMQKK